MTRVEGPTATSSELSRWCLRIGVACSLLALAACSSSRTQTTATSTTAGPTTTAAGDAPTTIGGATTIATTMPATSLATTTVPEGGFGEPVPLDDEPSAWIGGSQEGDPEVLGAPDSCAPFFDAIAGGPYTVQQCGIWNALGGDRVWTLTKGSTDRFFAIVWQQIAANDWVPALRALEPAADTWLDVTILTDNIDGGPNDELVMGTRYEGTGGYLDLSIVDIRSGNPRVVAVSNGVHQGIALLRFETGVEFWTAVYADADPECCPSTFQRYTMFATDLGDWLVVPGASLPAGDPGIPASEF